MIRNVVALLRGKATPLQVFLAGLLGGLIGFVPSFSTSGGLLVGYVLLLLVLNANVGLCLLVAAGAKVLSLLAMPLSFSLGRVLLEGPASGLFETLINAPVFAWFGLEYYATSGGLVLGAVVGLVAGGLMAKSLAGFREKMKRVEQKHEKFSTVSSRWWSRLFLWCLLGKGHGKATYGDLVEKGRGKPLRFAGVIVAAVFAAVLFLAPNLMSGPYLAGVAKGGLESWNGATVDIDELNLDLAGGKLSLSGLALADPNDLSADLFRATQLEADIGTDDLLRKKLTIDRLVIVDGATGAARSSPGVLTAPAPEPAPHAKKGNGGLKEAGKNLDEYLANAKEWKDRLAQVQEWLDTLSPDDGGDGGDGGAVKGESLRDRLEREVAAKGYAGVSADHLVHESPSLLIRELVAGGVRCDQLDGEPLDIRIENISTQPSLVLEPARLTVVAQDGTLDVDIGLGGAAANPAANRLKFVLKGVPAESLSGSLEVDGKPVLSDGTIDVSLDGHWAGGEVGQLDLPLDVTLHGVTVRTPMGGRAFEKLTLPFGLRGPMDNPQVSFDGDALHEAIMAGAAAQLDAAVDAKTAEARGALEDKANEHLKDAQSQLGDGIGDALGGLFGGDDDKDDKDDKDEKKKKKKKKKSKKAADDTMEDD